MRISEIYSKYSIPRNLQLHMLRVAAGVQIICNQLPNFPETRQAILTALVHDLGNIVKFRLDESMSDYKTLKNLQEEFIQKYGPDDHLATILIMREMGLSERLIEIMESMPLYKAVATRDSRDLAAKICFYCDKRTVPEGFVSIDERVEDIKARYPEYKGMKLGTPEYSELLDSVKEIETQIKQVCPKDPSLITTDEVEALIPEMEMFEVCL